MEKIPEFVTFKIEKPANGLERGWYYRITESLHNEPIGPYPTETAAYIAVYFALPKSDA